MSVNPRAAEALACRRQVQWSSMVRRRGLLILATALACAADAEELLVDEGRACIDVAPGDGYRAVVDSERCVSPCDELVDATCTVTFENRVVTVESSITVKRTSEVGCGSGCQSPTLTCPVPPLEDGIYTVAYGDAITAVTIPFEAGMGVCAGAE